MAILSNPITLPVGKMLSTMTTLLNEVRFTETIEPSSIVNEFVDSCRIGKVDFGKGIVNTFKLDVQPVKTYSETSSALTITKPNVAQETITIDNYKFVPLSMSEILSRDAFVNGYGVDSFFSFVMSLLEDTVKFKLYDDILSAYLGWTPVQVTQTVTIQLTDLTGLTGADLIAAKQSNNEAIATTVRKTINNMKIKNNKFTDAATYVDANDGQTYNVVTCLKDEDLKTVWNDNFYSTYMASNASLYHDDKLDGMLPKGKNIVLPEDAIDVANVNTICWVTHKNKFALADFYKVVLSILDPSNMYTNYFEHFAYGVGMFTYLPGVKFVANFS